MRRPLLGRARGKQCDGSARTWRGSSAEAGAAAQGPPPRHAAIAPPSGPAASSRLAQVQHSSHGSPLSLLVPGCGLEVSHGCREVSNEYPDFFYYLKYGYFSDTSRIHIGAYPILVREFYEVCVFHRWRSIKGCLSCYIRLSAAAMEKQTLSRF